MLLLHDVRLRLIQPGKRTRGEGVPRPAACYRPLWRRWGREGTGMVVTLGGGLRRGDLCGGPRNGLRCQARPGRMRSTVNGEADGEADMLN
jgi:hypothetical protein